MRHGVRLVPLLTILAVAPPCLSRTWHIKPDGSGDFATIQEGLDGAAVGDTLALADGTFSGPGNVALNPDGKTLTVRSASGNTQLCAIDGEGAAAGFQFMSGETSEFTLENISITDCSGGSGGAIYCLWSTPTIRNCRFVANRATQGGAFYVAGPGLVVTECTFLGNSASSSGGAVYGTAINTSLTIADSHFESNDAFYGGAIGVTDGTSLQVTGCTLLGNTATNGAGAYCSGDGSHISLASSVLENNIAFGSGGAIIVRNEASCSLEDCTIRGNLALGSGGAFNVYNHASCSATRCLLSGNYADDYGGGVWCKEASASLSSCTLTGNHGRLCGGGLFAGDAASIENQTTVVYANCSFVGADVGANSAILVEFECCILDSTRHISTGSDPFQYLGINVFSDPLFCDPESCDVAPTIAGTYTVHNASPALSANNPCGLLIGARGHGCGAATASNELLRPSSWAFIKSRYR